MAIHNTTQAVQQAARLLAGMDWFDQNTAREVAPMAAAVMDLLLVVNYQAGTGRAHQADFHTAMNAVRQTLPTTVFPLA